MPTAESKRDYDAIIVGARVGGTAAAIILARQGRKVLLVDKAAFPSDTISTHIVLSGGTRVLARLGVLEMLEREGGVRFSRSRNTGPGFDYSVDLRREGDDLRGLCLGRMKMDARLLEAARDAGSVTIREQFRFTELLTEGQAVIGIRGEDQSGSHEFSAPLTIGADGMRTSFAAAGNRRIGAFTRRDVPCARAYYYAYLDGVARDRLGEELIVELESCPGEASLACRCEDGRTVAAVAFDAAEMRTFRTDLAASFARHLRASELTSGLIDGSSVSGKIYSSGLLYNTYRDPVCDGALLLGDAGLHVDPLFGQGHSFALMSAEVLGDISTAWFSAREGKSVSANALSEFTRRRDALLMQHYNATVRVSEALAIDPVALLAHRVANDDPSAAEEVVRFAQMAPARQFPSFRLARLMAQRARAA